jgi:capsular polysaccharide biosynthesis protein
MTSEPLETYLQELARALRERGHEASRIVDEAREHLVDAVEDGLRRGLAREDAEREAVERFGPAELIAAQAPMRSHMMARVTVALDTVVGHWRWVTAATAVAAVLATAVSYYVLPAFYRSESMIAVIPQPRVSPFDSTMRLQASQERMQAITTTILSDARLDPILKDFGLGTAEKVRGNISVVMAPEQPDARDAIGVFTIGFQSPDPRLSQKVTQRLTTLFIVENAIDAAAVGRAIGDQFRVTKPPSLPKEPLRPALAKMTVSGAFAGLALSIGALVLRRPAR